MATHSRLSLLVKGLLVSTLLLSLSFSFSDATSRGMETMAVADGMATSCRGGACPTTTEGQDHEGMMHMSSLVPMNSDAAQAKISDSGLMQDHDDSESGRAFEPESMMDSERLRDSDIVRGDGMVSDTHWGRDPADSMSDTGRMRDFESDSSTNMHSISRGESDRMRNSERMSTNHMEAQHFENLHTISDSDGMMGRMGNLNGMRESQGMMDRVRDSRDRMIDSNRLLHSHRMTDLDRMMNSDRMRDSRGMMDRMIDSDRMRDSHGMVDSNEMINRMKDSHRMIDSDSSMSTDSDRMGNSHEVMDSEGMRNSHQMTSSNTVRDSEINHMIRNSERSSADLEAAKEGKSEIMQSGDRIMASEGTGDLENGREAQNMMDGSAAAQRRAHLDGEMERGSDMMRFADQMGNWNNGRRASSNMMRSSDRMQEGSERLSANSDSHDGTRKSDVADYSRMGSMAMQQSSTAEPSSCNGASCRSTSHQMMGDAEQMRDFSNRRGNLQRTDSEMVMRNMQGSEQMSTVNSDHHMRNSKAAEHSRMGHMEITHDQSSTMEPSSCHGTSCRIDQMGDAEQMAMAHIHRRGDLEMRRDSGLMRNPGNTHEGSKQMRTNSQSLMRNSDGVEHSRMGHTQKQHSTTSSFEESNCGRTCGSEEMQESSRRLDAEEIGSQSNQDSEFASSGIASERCSGMNAADCTVAQIDGEFTGSQKMDRIAERKGSSNSCRFGADCHVAPGGEVEGSQTMDDHESEIKGLPTSCRFNGADCHVNPDRETSNARPTMSCTNEHCRQSMANSEETMANSKRMHRTRNDREIVKPLNRITSSIANHEDTTDDSETMQVRRDRHLGSVHETETRSSGIWGSKMAHDLTSKHSSANAEISHPSSCSNEANCEQSSGIMHISSRDSKMMAHRNESEMSHNRLSSENTNMTTKDRMNSSAEMRSDSQMMLNAEEINNADSLPIHRHD